MIYSNTMEKTLLCTLTTNWTIVELQYLKQLIENCCLFLFLKSVYVMQNEVSLQIM